MFIELIDTLRCTRAHEDSWLVGAFDVVEARDIVRGTLGCPVCRAAYPIVERVARFDEGGEPPRAGEAPLSAPEGAMQLAALLDLTEGGGYVVLGGGWGHLAPDLLALVERVHPLLLNPPAGVALGPEVSALVAVTAIPVAGGTARGVALDEPNATPDLLAAAVRALRPGGRLIAPVRTPLPAGVAELARDERLWVAERSVDRLELIGLGRR